MQFSIDIPVKIISGRGCVRNSSEHLSLGKKAFIVCGSSGASSSGALTDVLYVLEKHGIVSTIFNKICGSFL